jgi:fluoride ion exporter CrcB/FEX
VGTLLVNVSGSFAIAILGALLVEGSVEERTRMFWVLGFLGSFTTFSSLALQTVEGWASSPAVGVPYAGVGGVSVQYGLMGFDRVSGLLSLRQLRFQPDRPWSRPS